MDCEAVVKLRIARKIARRVYATRAAQSAPRWWTLYSTEQLARAQRRLGRSWATHRTREVRDFGRVFLGITPDYTAMQRLNGCRLGQGAIHKMQREGTWKL